MQDIYSGAAAPAPGERPAAAGFRRRADAQVQRGAGGAPGRTAGNPALVPALFLFSFFFEINIHYIRLHIYVGPFSRHFQELWGVPLSALDLQDRRPLPAHFAQVRKHMIDVPVVDFVLGLIQDTDGTIKPKARGDSWRAGAEGGL